MDNAVDMINASLLLNATINSRLLKVKYVEFILNHFCMVMNIFVNIFHFFHLFVGEKE